MINPERRYSKAAVHVHSNFSLDSEDSPETVVQFAAKNGFNVLVLTDHDTVAGNLRAIREGRRVGVDVLPGIEVTVGRFLPHFLGINIESCIKNGQGNDLVAREIKEAGGFSIIAHPGSYPGYSGEILRLIKEGIVDGIERINGRVNYFPKSVEEYLDGQIKRKVAELGGADSHCARAEFLSAWTFFPGKSADDFLKALKDKTTIPQRGSRLPLSLKERTASLVGGLLLLPISRIKQNKKQYLSGRRYSV